MPRNSTPPQTSAIQRTFLSSLKEMGHVGLDQLNRPPIVTPDFAVVHHVCPSQLIQQFMQTQHPYQVDDYRFVLFHRANIHVTANLQQYHIADRMLAFVGNGSIMQFEGPLPDDVQISALLLNYDYIRYLMHNRLPSAQLGHLRNAVLQLDDSQYVIISQMIGTLYLLVSQPDYDRLAAESQLAALLRYICDQYVRTCNTATPGNTRAEVLFHRFIALVNQHYAEQHQLHFYADQLCVTDHYLSSVVRQVSQVSAKEWIDRALIAKAKVALRHTDVTTSQLADQLNFPNTPFFCKFFKRLTGCTPTEYSNLRNPSSSTPTQS